LFPLRASASRAAFQGHALQRLMRSAPGTASSISLKPLLRKLFALCNLACLSTQSRHSLHQKAVGPPPLPGRWPSDPYRPVTGLRNAPLGAVPRAAPRLSRSLITAGHSLLLLRIAGQGSNTLGRAIFVPNLSTCQTLTKSRSRRFHLPKTGEIVVSRSVFRKAHNP
jgi:hypothetical protein